MQLTILEKRLRRVHAEIIECYRNLLSGVVEMPIIRLKEGDRLLIEGAGVWQAIDSKLKIFSKLEVLNGRGSLKDGGMSLVLSGGWRLVELKVDGGLGVNLSAPMHRKRKVIPTMVDAREVRFPAEEGS